MAHFGLFDPIIRFLQWRICRSPSTLTAYADDLAFVLVELFEGLQEMCIAFPIISSATQLHLNFHKTIIVPLFSTYNNDYKTQPPYSGKHAFKHGQRTWEYA